MLGRPPELVAIQPAAIFKELWGTVVEYRKGAREGFCISRLYAPA
jgi:hypothetical protein